MVISEWTASISRRRSRKYVMNALILYVAAVALILCYSEYQCLAKLVDSNNVFSRIKSKCAYHRRGGSIIDSELSSRAAMESRSQIGENVQKVVDAAGIVKEDDAVVDDNDNVNRQVATAIRKSLRELGYSDTDIDSMKPEIAKIVVRRQLQKPASGMPKSWRIEINTANANSTLGVASSSVSPIAPRRPTGSFLQALRSIAETERAKRAMKAIAIGGSALTAIVLIELMLKQQFALRRSKSTPVQTPSSVLRTASSSLSDRVARWFFGSSQDAVRADIEALERMLTGKK